SGVGGDAMLTRLSAVTFFVTAGLLAVVAVHVFGADKVDPGLSIDSRGWAYRPVIAAGEDGRLYAASSQHRNPAQWEFVGTYAKRWTGSGWEGLGGRVGHSPG